MENQKQLLSLIILHQIPNKKPVLLSTNYNLGEYYFWQKPSIQGICVFASREVTERLQPNTLTSLKYQAFYIHVRVLENGLSAACVTNEAYPKRVAFVLASEALEKVTSSGKLPKLESVESDQNIDFSLAELVTKYATPSEIDKIQQIKEVLEDNRVILMKTIEDLIGREQRLNKLIESTSDLDFQTKAFAQSSKDLNSCWNRCNIL
eukprot:TRINITY_DN1065_c3_g1_i3.p1 TRINITY_DN1065_c3_g1~~TRINITY_DN1065_c3_g1_i3.p1  ORF type:complete len:207 (+),score=37.37 TRINITY_DN1065_c3_g1_i3:1357-1977(+)